MKSTDVSTRDDGTDAELQRPSPVLSSPVLSGAGFPHREGPHLASGRPEQVHALGPSTPGADRTARQRRHRRVVGRAGT